MEKREDRCSLSDYSIAWNSQSENSAGSMPFGGHSIGGNVWVESDRLYFYLAQSGWFDENNSLLKAGRFCISVQPSPFIHQFKQELVLPDGFVRITGDEFKMELWAQSDAPVVHVDIQSEVPRQITAAYQNWRFEDRVVNRLSWELFQCAELLYYPLADTTFHRDELMPLGNRMLFYHRNRSDDLSFDKELTDQGLSACRDELYNPQKNRIMGGIADFGELKYQGDRQEKYMDTQCRSFEFAAEQPLTELHMEICLRAEVEKKLSVWRKRTENLLEAAQTNRDEARQKARQDWRAYLNRSFVKMDECNPDSEAWKIGRNYQLFSYMLGLNERGFWPGKFNGGLLTFDPILGGKNAWSKDALHYTPDFRLWGGGTHTIQNQRLLYWPMLKRGDFRAMRQHFGFFLRILSTAEYNVSVHGLGQGAMFPEQLGSYGVCCGCANEWGNRTGLPVTQIKYHFSNSLETALMMLDYAAFTEENPRPFFDFIDAVLNFYDSFYPDNDSDGRMILYPANALETYHVVKNPADAIAGLRSVLTRLLSLPDRDTKPIERERWRSLLRRVPELPRMEKDGKTLLAPAETPSILHNCELPQLYSVHPYDLFGVGLPELELARDTARLGPETQEQLTHISWHPTGVMYARLGMVDEAWAFLKKKLADGPFRFPAFWGPGHDWTPDHNWGGSGMLQLQEMLLQTRGDELRILPCWPKQLDVRFRLHAPRNTVVDCEYRGGRIAHLEVNPNWRMKDVILPDGAGKDAQ